MGRIILKDNGEIDALEIIKSYGFSDTTPQICLCTKKIFEKEGRKYRFVGWHHPVQNPLKNPGRTWEDVELEEI